MAEFSIDIKENDIHRRSEELLATLLKDHTMTRAKRKSKEIGDSDNWNIFWATSDYEDLGEGFQYHDQILPKNITGKYGSVVQPRICKDKDTQVSRSHDKAEVFTPSWICNTQNNLVDAEWFGRENVFNIENADHTWTVNTNRIIFPENKSWMDYIRDTRMEITCGEAPFLASRYDTVTGEFIPIPQRIGLLDRKLRVVNENCHASGEWLKAAQEAYKSIYGYEWQGDSLLIARETLLYTFIENYRMKFGYDPQEKSMMTIAYIISWNLWQMDGLKCVVPDSCGQPQIDHSLFGDQIVKSPCEGCRSGDFFKHNGIKCEIRNWRKKVRKDREEQVENFINSLT